MWWFFFLVVSSEKAKSDTLFSVRLLNSPRCYPCSCKYEYVKDFEVNDEVLFPNLIVVRIRGCNFQRFCELHEFEKPNDEKALNLMNACATAVLKEYPDIVFSYGFGDEYSFVFNSETNFYQRRASKILSLFVSFFTSSYVIKWKDYFQQELKSCPLFQAHIICCATVDVLQAYLAWRQRECHSENQYNTCLWNLIKCGKTELEAQEMLKGTQKQEKNELLFQQFNINYKTIHKMFRQGSCVLKTEIEAVVKYNRNGTPVRRLRRNITLEHCENIASRSFWNEHACLVKEIGSFREDINKIRPEYVKSFTFENKLMPSTWIVVRIDGCHFHRFSEVHEFEKPNDMQALNLMNSCAAAVVGEFNDIVFSYGVSDEYSFILKEDSQFYHRRASYIVSIIVSFFTAMYVMKWEQFFPQKELKYTPCFDGRAVCYPSREILRDYLAWRQVDCHINNQYNTCFWELVKSGRSKSEAQEYLKGTQKMEKYELLAQQFNIEYNKLPVMFRQGSSVLWDKDEDSDISDEGAAGKTQKRVVVKHCNIIEPSFWKANPSILNGFHSRYCKPEHNTQ